MLSIKSEKKILIFSYLILISISLLLSTTIFAWTGSERLITITGHISNIKGMVITLDKIHVFYPAIEIYIPDWVVVGSYVGVSYYKENNKNCYLWIEKPGEQDNVGCP
jgi:hypothetical protein